MTVELVDVDNAPVAADKSFSVAENAAPGTAVGTATATDADNDAISFAITGGNAGSVFAIDAATGAITVAGSLNHEATGTYTLTVRATAGVKSDDATVTVTVTDVNESPVLGAIADQNVTEDAAITPIQVSVSDPDQGDSATVTVAGLPAGLTYDGGTRRIVGTPTVPGSTTVTVTATDGDLTASRTFTIVVANVNDKPVIAPVSDRNATEDTAITPIVITAGDEDGDTVTLATSTLPTGLSFNAATGTISGTPTVSGSFLVTVTATDGEGGQATDDFTIDVAAVNDTPVITSIGPDSLSGTEDEAFDEDVTVVAVDEDGDDLDLSVSGLPAGLTGTDNGDGTVTIAGTPTSAGVVTATITATDPDGESDTVDLTVTIAAAAETCSPISTLPCSDVLVGLPFDLTFDGTEDGLDSTGFTMVDPPSARSNTAQAPAPATPTYPTVPGFEPSLVTAQGGTLSVQATKGIMFRFPGTGGSTETNSQLNALGVGVDGGTEGYEVESTVVAPTFPGAGDNSQQGGVWFGLDEDDYVKLAVVRATATTNKIQMLTEVGALADPDTRYALNSATFPAGQDVRLLLRVEDTPGAGGTAAAFYSVGAGAPVRLTDAANTVSSTALPIPQRFFDGVEVGDDTARFAGVFTTKRRAAAADNVTVNFADFGVSEYVVPNVAPTLAAIGNVSATEGVAISPVTVTAQDADGDDLTISSDLAVNGLTLVDNEDGTATLSGAPATGTAAASPYQVTVTADDGEATATRTFTVAVSAPAAPCAPITTEPCATVPVALPLSLDFGGTAGGLKGTGFTLVDAPSQRSTTTPAIDQAPAPASPSVAGVPGYEPGLLTVADGALTISATKGIQFRAAGQNPAATSPNAQINALGVGVKRTTGTGYEVETTLVAPTFPSASGNNGSQQGGLWFGLNKDNYVKLVVAGTGATTSKVQMVTEVAGVATPSNVVELNSATFAPGSDVRLVLTVDDVAATGATGVRVSASYAVGAGALTALTDAANTNSPALAVPQSFVDGAALADGTVVSRAGVFASKRNAPASEVVPVKFASFDVREKGVVAPTTGLDVTVNFQSELAPVPAGTLRDFGQAYEQRTSANQGDGAYTYGWVKEGTDEPFSLVKNGRDRDRTTGAASTDQRLDTILHMQYQDVPAGDCAANVCEDGSWNLDVDNGAYEVTVAVGDQPGANSVYDSLHAINLENQTTITGFQATAAKEYETVTQVVGVADGELTVSAVGGTNTKINYVRVKQLSPTVVDPRPFVVDVRPGNRSAGALRGEGIGTDLHLVGTTANPGPVDKTTISTSTVKLFEVVPGSADVAVAGNPGSTGGGDAINFQQSAALKADTTYRYVVDGVKDTLGNTFLPFTSTFTTGTEIDGGEETGTFSPVAGVNFEKVDLNKNGKHDSSLVVHQGYLWTTTVGQGMFRYPINADGTLGAEQAINAFAGRAAIGLVFDKTNPSSPGR